MGFYSMLMFQVFGEEQGESPVEDSKFDSQADTLDVAEKLLCLLWETQQAGVYPAHKW